MEMVFTANEIYVLAGVMKAKYIDYAYVAGMDATEEDFSVFANGIRSDLIRKEVLQEDFFGDVTLNDNYKGMLAPIFLGEVEVSINNCELQEKQIEMRNYHFLDAIITEVRSSQGKLVVRNVNEDDIREQLYEVAPRSEEVGPECSMEEVTAEQVKRVLAIKRNEVGVSSLVGNFLEIEGYWYRDLGTELQPVTRTGFIEQAIEMINRGEKQDA